MTRRRGGLLLTTILAVLGVSLVIGAAANFVAVKVAVRREMDYQRRALEALLDVVEPTAAAACFVGDATLGQQVVQGLVGTRSVRGATLRSGPHVLAQAARPETRLDPGDPASLHRRLVSPFSSESAIGELVLLPDPDVARRQAAHTAALVRMVVFGITLALGLTLGLTLHLRIIRPITGISNRLHGLEATTGARLSFPPGHEADEIGQLVQDVNALVEQLMATLHKERELAGQLELDKRKVQSILENAGTGILVADAGGRLEAWTPAFLRLLDLEQVPPVKGTSLPVYFGTAGNAVEALLRRCQAEGAKISETLRLSDFEGERHRWLTLTLDPVGPDWVQGLLEDVTTYRDATEAAEDLAIHDLLTGALNRLGAERALGELLKRTRPGIALMLVDLDLFKAVNDSYGHDAGDEVLREVTRRMAAVLRRSDLVARLGGDEFLLVAEALVDESTALAVAQKIIQAIRAPILLSGGAEARIGASVGVALCGEGVVQSADALVKRADQAMYQAKQAGRNCARLAVG